MIPYGKQYLDKNDIKSVNKVLKSDWLTQGPDISNFEKDLASYCGAKYAVAVANGTAALHIAFLAAGLKKGDEVITTPNTFVATTNMLLALGVKPIFCDIRLDTYNFDESMIEKLINKKTKAIVPVHFAGQPCAMNKILAIAKKYKLIVIEDACHALGAKFGHNKIGSLKSDMTIFSFHPVKSITTAEGGAILTNNLNYYRKLNLLRSHGIYKDKKGKNQMIQMGYNYRLNDIAAALGSSQLKKIENFIAKRHLIVQWYFKKLNDCSEIILPQELKEVTSAWHLFVIRLKNKNKREKLSRYLNSHGIATNFHYPCVYKHKFYQQNGYRNIKCLNAEKYSDSNLVLPLFYALNKKQVDFISETIIKFFQGNAEFKKS